MDKKKLIIIIDIIVLSLACLLILPQMIYAEELQQFYGYNSELDFKNDFEYKLLENKVLSNENRLVCNVFKKNFAYIHQNGNRNQGSITQIGNMGSTVEIIQIGNENKAKIKQFANYTQSEIFQFGNNHDLSIEQWGSQGKIYVIQSGNNFENKEVKIMQF